ncbi:MAG: ATPase [Dysgonamonadaceae bacterium]|jgi:N-acetylglucosamine kinase-like BadF-type ATPase|nr:ATPase [Dysgonamonadaceae bacterium]
MILIADSGSTKTKWAKISPSSGIEICVTSGLNPFFTDETGILRILNQEFSLPKSNIEAIYFYGAGCIPGKIDGLKTCLSTYFQTTTIEIESDLMAAARSLCGRQAGIACILGTGSNSCYYDGTKIAEQTPALGYVIGDEGSGAALGKQLLSGIFKKQLPASIRTAFHQQFALNQPDIIEKVYRQPYPNRFLAQFTPFIVEQLSKPAMAALVDKCFSDFVQRNLLQYTFIQQLPVHFTGSVAYYLKSRLEKVLHDFNLQSGKVTSDPMEGLIHYHTTN